MLTSTLSFTRRTSQEDQTTVATVSGFWGDDQLIENQPFAHQFELSAVLLEPKDRSMIDSFDVSKSLLGLKKREKQDSQIFTDSPAVETAVQSILAYQVNDLYLRVYMAQNYALRDYEIDDRISVEGFLYKYNFLRPFLDEAPQHIHRIFGHDIHLSLVLEHDYEEGTEPELFIYIQTRLAPQEAFQKLRQLDGEWFLSQLEDLNGKLNISLSFEES